MRCPGPRSHTAHPYLTLQPLTWHQPFIHIHVICSSISHTTLQLYYICKAWRAGGSAGQCRSYANGKWNMRRMCAVCGHQGAGTWRSALIGNIQLIKMIVPGNVLSLIPPLPSCGCGRSVVCSWWVSSQAQNIKYPRYDESNSVSAIINVKFMTNITLNTSWAGIQ